jgi:hypothetical protein
MPYNTLYSLTFSLVSLTLCCSFVLKQKNQKFKLVRRLLCRTWPALQKPAEPGLETFTPCFAALCLRFSKKFLCPAAAPATIVLPVFGRSCRTDGGLWFIRFITLALLQTRKPMPIGNCSRRASRLRLRIRRHSIGRVLF